jgi:hypothetical protein
MGTIFVYAHLHRIQVIKTELEFRKENDGEEGTSGLVISDCIYPSQSPSPLFLSPSQSFSSIFKDKNLLGKFPLFCFYPFLDSRVCLPNQPSGPNCCTRFLVHFNQILVKNNRKKIVGYN